MDPRKRIALFVAGLVVVFATALALGSATDPVETEAESHGGAEHGGHGVAEERGTGHGGHKSAVAPAGLAVSEGGYSLRLLPFFAAAGEVRQLRFRIEGPDGETARDFDRLHEREMHLIVVRRDGAHFQHLHPELDASGIWTTPLVLPAAGVYRAFADFSAGGRDHTLATDLFASGAFVARSFPAPAPVDETAGYEVRLGDSTPPRAGQPASLRFAVTRDGRTVDDLKNYLGAKGHLVALREGDLAFLHVHPDEAAAANEIPFTAHFPTAGRYRLYLQFKRVGQVSTAEFTVAVAR